MSKKKKQTMQKGIENSPVAKFIQKPYVLPLDLKLSAVRARLAQPKLIALSGKTGYSS